MKYFSHFLAIDWSGAAGERHKGIAMAFAALEGGPPVIANPPDKGWSRTEVLTLLRDDLPQHTLVGMDLGISLPFADCGAFFPGRARSPKTARDLWALIDSICADDPYCGANSFVDHADFAPYFRRHGGREGAHFRDDPSQGGRGRLRVTEHAQAAMGLKPYSNFNLVGAAQVGKSSLTGMRVLHQLKSKVPVWPIDPLPAQGSVICEIYTSLAAKEAGRAANQSKIRDFDALNEALTNLGSPPAAGSGAIDDHSADALITAAWLRKVHEESERWSPKDLTPDIARTEGWTFGAL
ncbi:MAG: hypothetical protein AAGK17_02350 [Pseudomonadota bacterium]